MKKKCLFLASLCLTLMLIPACKKDKNAASNLSCSPTKISALADGGIYTIDVNSAGRWEAWTTSTWIELHDEYGSGNGNFQCNIKKNTSSSSRSGYITIMSDNGNDNTQVLVDVNQTGGSQQGGDDDKTTIPSTPSNVNAYTSGNSIVISWSTVSGASKYNVYRSSSSSGTYSYLGYSYSTSYTDNNPLKGTNYYKVSAENNAGESSKSSYAYCSYSGSGTGGGSTTKPSTPTGVTANNEGSTMLPYVIVRWNEVADATSYIIYRSTSASGTYTQIGTATYNSYADNNPKDGTNYYKVAAKNSAGTSSQSSYASVTIDRNAVSPCPPSSLTGSVSGTKITMRWTLSTTSGCGKPSKIRVRLYIPNHNTGSWVDDATLSGTATSYSFTYPNYVDDDGFVKMGIILENDYGSGSKMLVYDTKKKKWL